MKVCSNCKQEKENVEFHAHTSHKDGLSSACKECTRGKARQSYWANPEKSREYDRNYRRETPGQIKKLSEYQRKHRYGISPQKYSEMLQAQGGVCAICGLSFSSLCVDHNHKTGEIRGLLCSRCNSGIAFLNDSPSTLTAAVAYLTKTKTESQSPMKKLLNRILKFVGINVVKAKKTRIKRAGYRSHIPIEDAKTDAKCIPSSTCCADEYNSTPADHDGHTHYVGDSCPGGHVDASPTQDNNITGPTS